ncbi:hypothetical protein QJQ45_009380 [Haematococcus lacustris]|nr:hypothetical protein QJQ45_009380 [Haematococcus lacustris]
MKLLAWRRETKPSSSRRPAALLAVTPWDEQSGRLTRGKLTKGQVQQASGLNNARRNIERCLAPLQPHRQHLAAANLKHITVTLVTWDAVWEVYLDPREHSSV